MKITDKDVYEYREIYYEHLKFWIKLGISQDNMTELMKPVFEMFDWTEEKFRSFQTIHLLQIIGRLKEENKNLQINCDVELDVGNTPELSCPLRSEENI